MTRNTYVDTETFENEFVKTELRNQQKVAVNLKSATDADKIYVFDSAGYFTDADTLLMCDVTVKTKNGQYAVLSEAAQNTMDLDAYQQWSNEDGEVQLGVDGIGCYV